MRTELRFTSLNKSNLKNKSEYLYPWLDINKKSKILKDNIFYHWDNKKKLKKDSKKLTYYYEKLIKNLTNKLNKYHKINLPLRSWRIILGPWLWWFLESTFERYQALDTYLKKNVNKKYYSYFDNINKNLFPKSVENMSNYYFSETWNNQIFLKIVDYFFSEKIKIISKKNQNPKIQKFINRQDKIYKNIKFPKKNIISKFLKNQKYLISRGTFNFIEILKMNYEFGFIQNIMIPKKFDLKKKIDHNLRYKLFLNNKKKTRDNFEKFISKIIGEEIPTTFLENFKYLYNLVDQFNLPKKPSIIFDTTHLYFFTLMMIYTAKKIHENKTRLYYFQHGTELGMSQYNWNEDHEILISDKYFTWGWKHLNNKVIPYKINYNLNSYKKINFQNNKKILFIMRTSQIFFRSGSSLIGYKDWKNYLTDTLNFPKFLKKENLKNLIVRFSNNNKNGTWGEHLEWKKKWKNIDYDFRSVPIIDQIKKSKIVICSYNSTLFLECMASNLPVLMFMPKRSYELRQSAKKNFKTLYKNKIVFDKIEDLAKKLNSVNNNIEDWWFSREIQLIRKNFCSNYAKTNLDNRKLFKIIN